MSNKSVQLEGEQGEPWVRLGADDPGRGREPYPEPVGR
jgi:hypothetical protein